MRRQPLQWLSWLLTDPISGSRSDSLDYRPIHDRGESPPRDLTIHRHHHNVDDHRAISTQTHLERATESVRLVSSDADLYRLSRANNTRRVDLRCSVSASFGTSSGKRSGRSTSATWCRGFSYSPEDKRGDLIPSRGPRGRAVKVVRLRTGNRVQKRCGPGWASGRFRSERASEDPAGKVMSVGHYNFVDASTRSDHSALNAAVSPGFEASHCSTSSAWALTTVLV